MYTGLTSAEISFRLGHHYNTQIVWNIECVLNDQKSFGLICQIKSNDFVII